MIWFRYSFICQDTSTRRQRRDLFSLRVELPLVTTSLTTQKVETIPLSALPKDTTKRTCRHISTLTLLNAEPLAKHTTFGHQHRRLSGAKAESPSQLVVFEDLLLK